jgi:hypothetical protein
MSNAVTATGILVKRGPISPPATVAITSNSINAIASIVTSAAPHLLATGDEVLIAGSTSSVPPINGSRIVTVIDATHFSVPVATTVAGTGGTVQQNFQVVGELTEVTPGGMSRNKIDTTTHNDGAESHVLGILRQTDPGMKINYVGSDPTHVAVLADIANNVKNNWKILFPSGVSRTGQAYVQQFAFDQATPDAKQGATLTLTWAGIVVESAGT